MAEEYGVPLLGSLPLDIRIRQDADGGAPSVIADPQGRIAGLYREIARRAAARLRPRAPPDRPAPRRPPTPPPPGAKGPAFR
jgi:ATP-binding protein involved in chromosome partitioning